MVLFLFLHGWWSGNAIRVACGRNPWWHRWPLGLCLSLGHFFLLNRRHSRLISCVAFRHIANDTRQPSDMVAIRTHLLIAEIHFTTLWALDNLSRYSHATARAKRCLVAYLSPTLRAFNHCHNTSLYCFVIFYLCLNRISLSLCFPMKRLLSTKPFMPSSLPFAVYCHNRYSLPSVRTGCRDEYCAIMSL